MNKPLINGFKNVSAEGVTLCFPRKICMRDGGIASQEWWVSWDKIGSSLFPEYEIPSVAGERRRLEKIQHIK